MRRVLPVLAALALAGCSAQHDQVVRSHDLSVRIPSGWFVARRALTPVVSPRQVLAVASYRLPAGRAGAEGCSPKEALDRLPSSGVFIFGWEYDRPRLTGYRRSDFPPRPAHFRLTGFTQSECLGPGYVLDFRDEGRLFQVHVVLGPKAGEAERASALRVLDSLSVSRP